MGLHNAVQNASTGLSIIDTRSSLLRQLPRHQLRSSLELGTAILLCGFLPYRPDTNQAANGAGDTNEAIVKIGVAQNRDWNREIAYIGNKLDLGTRTFSEQAGGLDKRPQWIIFLHRAKHSNAR